MGAVILSVIGLGVSSAAIPDSTTGVITACRSSIGQLKVIDKQAGASCSVYGETEMSWNQAGPAGVTGATGATGPVGPAGAGTSFEHVHAAGRDSTSGSTFGTWVRTVTCSAGKKPISGIALALTLNDYAGTPSDSMPVTATYSGSGIEFGSQKVTGFPPYVYYILDVVCVDAAFVN